MLLTFPADNTFLISIITLSLSTHSFGWPFEIVFAKFSKEFKADISVTVNFDIWNGKMEEYTFQRKG